jgi:hypothetical protein
MLACWCVDYQLVGAIGELLEYMFRWLVEAFEEFRPSDDLYFLRPQIVHTPLHIIYTAAIYLYDCLLIRRLFMIATGSTFLCMYPHRLPHCPLTWTVAVVPTSRPLTIFFSYLFLAGRKNANAIRQVFGGELWHHFSKQANEIRTEERYCQAALLITP